MTAQSVDAVFYVQVEPDFWGTAGRLRGAKAVRITQSKPHRPIGGTVMCKLTLRFPASVFMPLQPEAVVVIPEGMAAVTPIEVEAMELGGESTDDDDGS